MECIQIVSFSWRLIHTLNCKPIINSIIYLGDKKRVQTICYGPTVGPELSLSGPSTLWLHIGPKAYRSSHISRKCGPKSCKSGPGPKYYRRTGLLYIIMQPGLSQSEKDFESRPFSLGAKLDILFTQGCWTQTTLSVTQVKTILRQERIKGLSQ